MIYIVAFPRMADVVPEGASGDARIEHFDVDESLSRDTMAHGMIDTWPSSYVSPGRYARLWVGEHMMMSDANHERSSSVEVVERAHGNVLIAGLGLGMILWPILSKPEVRSVTVVEKSPHVLKLVGPSLLAHPRADFPRIVFVVADIFRYRPVGKFNTIFFDIWPKIALENLRDIAILHRRFAKHLNPYDARAWMGSWELDLLQAWRKVRRRRARRELEEAGNG